MLMRLLFFIVSAMVLTASSSVHQDRILTIGEDGTILGLTKKYCPAKIDLQQRYLRINAHEVVFPECWNDFVHLEEVAELKLAASWYHDKEIMPDYLRIELTNNDRKEHRVLLLELATLKVIHTFDVVENNGATHFPKLQLDSGCLHDYHHSIRAVP